jgi:glycerophosphoryl diester phosphodiesterase
VTRPLVIAHRGATRAAPENSLAAFRAAGPAGADAVELDVHATADGVLVVHHDETVDGARHIPRVSAEALGDVHLANGEPLPTLAQALDAVGPAVGAFIEVKSLPPAFDEHLFAALAAGPNPAGYAIHSFDHRIVQRLGAQRPGLPRGVLSTSYPVRPLALLRDAGATMLWQERALIDPPLAELLHGVGARLFAWTVDRPEDMERLLACDVDGLCTNVPDIGRRVVDDAGYRR